MDELLAEVLALQQIDERLRRVLQTIGDGFAVLDFSLGHVFGKLRNRPGIEILAVENDKALQLYAVYQQGTHHFRAGLVALYAEFDDPDNTIGEEFELAISVLTAGLFPITGIEVDASESRCAAAQALLGIDCLLRCRSDLACG